MDDSTPIILIAEDSSLQRKQLEYILKKENYNVISSKNGKEAFEAASKNIPDLVITDLIMPGLDGYELCHKIKTTTHLKKIPVILLTNLSEPQDVIKGLEAGVDNFITKPYERQFLLSRVNYVLENNKIRQMQNIDSNLGLELILNGKKYFISADRIQIMDLLLSTYENAIHTNEELKIANRTLTELHKELLQKNSELEKLNQEKDKFLRMAAHDIRNPISAMLSWGNMIQDELREGDDSRLVTTIDLIRRSGGLVITLLNELLDLAVIESGKLKLVKTEFNLVEVVDQVKMMHKSMADKKSIEIVIDAPDKQIDVIADRTKIEQVLNNLVTNAVKFSYPKTTVKIIIEQTKRDVKISVSDEGQGIPADELDKLFTPFGKTSVKPTAGESSTGLGLSIVKKIIDAHNSKIYVASEIGQGTTFYFNITSAAK
ncbi:MAG: hybrid sensor histidine kinase/response regulator [Melioribacteraceae bacterium]|nr:hybrid sensor histidine kinase/response regulator [Melioribacteraceae bacterium]MDD3558550.1 hybrid sensor histidine kinase/response regulator [Melioribacteraceae bacterium]